MNKCGFILIDKPEGITSFQVISRLRKITAIKKIGHTGTLDPFATGLLPVCLGSATRLASFVSSAKKTYIAKIRFGSKTDTGDITGKITSSLPLPQITNPRIKKCISSILDLTHQTPPPYSAIKVNGKRSYELARNGKIPDLKPRPIKIYDFRIISFSETELSYQTTVSKGTYIRTLSEYFAQLLDTYAYTVSLSRIKIDRISLEKAVKLSEITTENWQRFLISPSEIIILPQLIISEPEATRFSLGNFIKVGFRSENKFLVVSNDNSHTFGVGSVLPNGLLKPDIVLHNCL